MNNSESNPVFDFLKMADQFIDAKVNSDLLEAAKQNDEGAYAMIKLLNEYGVYGRKCLELIQKLGLIFTMKDSLEAKEVQTNDKT